MKFIAVAIIVASLALASAAPLAENQYQFLFTKWVEQYDKQYEAKEFFGRYDTFKSNLNGILEHNAKGLNYTMAMNEFGDMTAAEYKNKLTGLKTINNYVQRNANKADLSHVTADASIDWRTKGAVTGVKNQGQCGSCWAFSTTGSMEGAWAISKKSLVSLSEQQLVDCAGSTGNSGCSGGLMDQAFEWIIQNKGLCSESSYAYNGADGTCQTCTNVAQISSFKDVTTMNEGELLKAVTLGPVSIAIEADQSGFQFYSGGVFDGACGTALDHGVLIVGYGTDSGKPYWIVKNSWGASWGEAGYIRLVRNKDQCGLAMQPSYPVV